MITVDSNAYFIKPRLQETRHKIIVDTIIYTSNAKIHISYFICKVTKYLMIYIYQNKSLFTRKNIDNCEWSQ